MFSSKLNTTLIACLLSHYNKTRCKSRRKPHPRRYVTPLAFSIHSTIPRLSNLAAQKIYNSRYLVCILLLVLYSVLWQREVGCEPRFGSDKLTTTSCRLRQLLSETFNRRVQRITLRLQSRRSILNLSASAAAFRCPSSTSRKSATSQTACALSVLYRGNVSPSIIGSELYRSASIWRANS